MASGFTDLYILSFPLWHFRRILNFSSFNFFNFFFFLLAVIDEYVN
jgi:hypothetical protein